MSYRSEAREKLLRGVSALADAVRVTLGPKSKSETLRSAFDAALEVADRQLRRSKERARDNRRHPKKYFAAAQLSGDHRSARPALGPREGDDGVSWAISITGPPGRGKSFVARRTADALPAIGSPVPGA